jgi:hypothetical protein
MKGLFIVHGRLVLIIDRVPDSRILHCECKRESLKRLERASKRCGSVLKCCEVFLRADNGTGRLLR